MPAVSLFTETVNKVHALETELAAAHERIRNLEIALKAARADKYRAQAGKGHPYIGAESRLAHSDLNALSKDDEEALFRQLKAAKIDDQVEAWSKPDTEDGKEPTTRRGGFLSPLLRACALLKR